MNTRQLQELGLLQENPSESSHYIHTTQPTNDVDFLWLLDGNEDFYRLPAQVTDLKKKQIIITDPSVTLGLIDTKEGLNIVAELWYGLIQRGFTVSVWTGNDLRQVTEASEIIPALKKIKPIHHHDLIKLLAEQGIASKDCYLAGMKQTVELLLQQEVMQSCENGLLRDGLALINVEVLMALPEADLETLLASLSDSSPILLNLSASNLAALSKDKNLISRLERHSVLHFCITDLPDDLDIQALLPIISLFKKAILSDKTTYQQLELISKYCPNIEEIDITSVSIGGNQDSLFSDFPSFSEHTTINFILMGMTESALLKRIQSCPTIKELTFANCDELFPLSREISLPATLKKLSIDMAEVTWPQVLGLLQTCPAIEEINLSYCDKLFPLSEEIILPATLKKLTLTGEGVTWPQVLQLLRICPAIEELYLSDVDEVLPLPLGASLPATLKKLGVSSTLMTWRDIANLVHGCSILEELYLNVSTMLGDLSSNLFFNTRLNKVSLERTNVTWQQVSHLLQSCPSIEMINVDQCGLLDELPDELAFLSQVKKIILPDNIVYPWAKEAKALSEEDVYRIEQYFPTMIINRGNEIDRGNKFGIEDELHNIYMKMKRMKADQGNSSYHKEGWETPENMVAEPELDGNTGDVDSSLRARQVFENIPPEHYRIKCFDAVSVSEVEVKMVKSSLHRSCNLATATGGESHTGYIELTHDDWTVLPTLTRDDKLIAIQTMPEIDYELHYSSTARLYYIKPKQPLDGQPVVITYTLESNYSQQQSITYDLSPEIHNQIRGLLFDANGKLVKNAEFEAFNQLTNDQKLRSLIAYFNLFSPKELDDVYLGCDLLNAIIRQKAGACRHRTMAFKALAFAFNLHAIAIYNDLHAFVEVMIDGMWKKADLGGAPAHVEIIPPPQLDGEIEKIRDVEKEEKIKNQLASVMSPDNPFRVWDTVEIIADSMNQYVSQLVRQADALERGRKNALCIINRSQISAFSSTLFQQNKSNCFYLPNLNHIKDKQTVIDNEAGQLQTQDSELKHFLQNAKAGDVLLVNWSDYEAEHVGYNSIMDTDHRKIKGMSIPEGVVVIGLIENNQTMGEDFYSRFRMVSDCPASLMTEEILPRPEKSIQQTKRPSREICFYDDAWRSVLLGQVSATNGHYQISSSILLEAINAGENNIVLRNAPWELQDFQLFITQLLAKRQIEVNGHIYSIPDDFCVLRDDRPYTFEHAQSTVEVYTKDISLQDTYLLNGMTFNALFQQIQSDNYQLNTLPGLLAAHQEKTLRLYVTQTLTDLQWARIFDVANKHQTKLHLIPAPGVRLPSHQKIVSTETLATTSVRVIETNDADYVSELFEDALIIPVNEKTTYADLTGTHVITKTKDEIHCEFHAGILTQALKSGKKVILKGSLSTALAQDLSPLFLDYLMVNGKREEGFTGELTFVIENNPRLGFVSSESYTVEQDRIWKKLKKLYPDVTEMFREACEEFCLITHLKPFQYTELKSMLAYLNSHRDSNPFKQILRARADYGKLKIAAEVVWERYHPVKKVEKTEQESVLEMRHNKLERMLSHDWYVFVAGPSGVGKSTTINQAMITLGYQPVTQAGSLKDKLKAWLKPGEKQCLFIDEANLYETGEFDILEGLYAIPPKLLIDGIYYDVPKENRLIFAGNFGHFLGRQELRFISRHGNVITFKEFDDAFLRETIMRPVCTGLKLTKEESDEMMQFFIRVYHHVNDLNPAKHPLTARNLQMMVMRYAITGNFYLAAYDEVCGVLKQKGRKEIAKWIKEKFEIDVSQLKREAKEQVKSKVESQGFLVTKKRINPVRIMQNLMKIRDTKMSKPDMLSGAGSNGLIIEGNPGIGKSFIAIEYLKAQGFVDGSDITRKEAKERSLSPNQRYYHIQAGDINEVKQTLLKAFHEGAWVIIDEMNTMPLEHLLNALLSGTTPEGTKAKHPGFFVTGTQNPVHYGKRSAYSEAFLNRFQKLDLKDYGKDDLKVIIGSMMNDAGEAEKLIDYYLNTQAYAQQSRKISPTPRDLIEEARGIKKS